MTTVHDLTQRHRAAQLLLRRATVEQLAKIWPALDWARLDSTYPAFVLRVSEVVGTNRRTSSGLASQYLRAIRSAKGIPGEAKSVFAEPLPAGQIGASLSASSIATLKKHASAGATADEALSVALTKTQGAMARLVLNGGRETILGTIKADPAAVGWQRVLGGSGCEFCRMLAGRGAVYKEDTGDFAAHDHCGCSIEPEYGERTRTVKAYVPSTRNITDVDRARVRAWMRDHPDA